MLKCPISTFFIISFLALASCKNNESSWDTGFIKIDPKLNDLNKLIQKIEPNKNYIYWEYMPEFATKPSRTEGDSLILRKHKIVRPNYGFPTCAAGMCVAHIMYIDSGNVNYVTSFNELRTFIGKVNNLEEAILLSRTDHLFIDRDDLKGGSFKKVSNGFKLYMMRHDYCPEYKESIKVTIDSSGNFDSKSNGIYFRSSECIQF